MTNAICKSYNESWVTIQTCRLKAVNRNITKFNFSGTFLHPAYDIGIKGEIFKKANGYKPWLFKADIDVCRFVKRPYNPIAIIVFRLFKDFTNFNHKCPHVVSINIFTYVFFRQSFFICSTNPTFEQGTQIVDGLYLQFNLLPHSIPTGDYLLSLTWLLDKRPQFFTDVYLEILIQKSLTILMDYLLSNRIP